MKCFVKLLSLTQKCHVRLNFSFKILHELHFIPSFTYIYVVEKVAGLGKCVQYINIHTYSKHTHMYLFKDTRLSILLLTNSFSRWTRYLWRFQHGRCDKLTQARKKTHKTQLTQMERHPFLRWIIYRLKTLVQVHFTSLSPSEKYQIQCLHVLYHLSKTSHEALSSSSSCGCALDGAWVRERRENKKEK